MNELLPTFLIIGAPKAGTTSIYNWLKWHPEIYMSPKKEPMFFCNYQSKFNGPDADELNEMIVWDYEEYLKLFQNGLEYKHRGEASTDYLSNPNAPYNIKNSLTNPKLIIVLRNPVKRAFSEHMHLKRDNLEDKSLIESIELEGERKSKSWNTLYRHIERGLYYKQVKKYFEVFNKENILILYFKELKNDTEHTYERILDFLDVKHYPLNNIRQNKSGIVKYQFIDDLFKSRRQSKLLNFFKKFFPPKTKEKIRSFIINRNIQSKSITKSQYDYLVRYFDEDVEKLSNLLNKDLTDWLKYSE